MNVMGKIGVPEAPLSEWTDVPAVGVEMHSRYWPGTGERGAAPILLLPGLALSSRSLFPLARRLSARGYEVHALDLPGFGRTRKPPKATWPAGPNVRAQADQLRDWMDSRGLGRVVLYGISVGSQVAADFAVRYPERVERLVLAGPAPDPAMRTPLRQYGGVLMNMPFEAPSLNDVFQVEYASAGLARMVQQLRRTVDDAIETKLPGIAVPALVVRGQFDQALSQAWAEKVAQLLPDARMAVIEGSGHNVQYTAPEVTAELIDMFLSGELDAPEDRTDGGIVVPQVDQGEDPLAPPQPISTAAKGAIDYAMVGLCALAPMVVAVGPRTRRTLTATAIGGAVASLLTDYRFGAVRKIPMNAKLNLDGLSGMNLMSSALRYRGEPMAGRLAMAALGAAKLWASVATRVPMGPARLIPLPAR